IFMHMPKSGGTTLESIVLRHYPAEKVYRFTGDARSAAEFRALPEEQRAGFDVLTGHVYFGIHRSVPAPAFYITMLRDPVERVVSLFYYIKRCPDHYMWQYGFHESMTLREFLEQRHCIEMDNLQTRYLCPEPEIYLPFGQVTAAMCSRAVGNLLRMKAIGLTDRFDESLEILSSRFGWNNLEYQPLNVTEGRPSVSEIEPATIELIREMNEFDIAVYTTARLLFEEQLDELRRAAAEAAAAAAAPGKKRGATAKARPPVPQELPPSGLRLPRWLRRPAPPEETAPALHFAPVQLRYDTSRAYYRPSWPAERRFVNREHEEIFDATENLPGWQDPGDSFKLYEAAYHSGSVILEIGVFGGRSATVELRGALAAVRDRGGPSPQYYGVDPDPEAFERTTETLDQMELAGRALFYSGDLRQFLHDIPIVPTMVFVDGSHQYDGVWADLEALSRILVPGTAVMCHDYSNRDVPGVRKAIDEWCAEPLGAFELWGVSKNTAILRATDACRGRGAPRGLSEATFRATADALAARYREHQP